MCGVVTALLMFRLFRFQTLNSNSMLELKDQQLTKQRVKALVLNERASKKKKKKSNEVILFTN